MKTFGDIKHELANELGFPDWHELQEQYPKAIYRYYEQAAKLYAQQVAEDVRQRCFENAEIKENWYGGDPVAWVDSESILNTEIILP